MPDLDKAFKTIANSLNLPIEDVRQTVMDLAARAGRLTTWRGINLTALTPPQLVQKLYAERIAAGTMHTGIIFNENKSLYRHLKNWLRTPSNPIPDNFYIPSKSEWLARERVRRRRNIEQAKKATP